MELICSPSRACVGQFSLPYHFPQAIYMELFPLTLLLVLRTANVSIPPYLHNWCKYTIDYLDELHLLLCTDRLSEDLLKKTHDFQTLSLAKELLQDSWNRYLRRTGVSPAVMCLLKKLAIREQRSKMTDGQVRQQALRNFCDVSEQQWCVAQEEEVQRLHENYSMSLNDMDVVYLPLPCTSQDELEMLLTYWNIFQQVPRMFELQDFVAEKILVRLEGDLTCSTHWK